MCMTSGRHRLRAWIDRSKVNQNEAAKLLDVHPVVLSEWLSGYRGRKPGLTNALKIERVTGIPVESWTLTHVSAKAGAGSDVDGNP